MSDKNLKRQIKEMESAKRAQNQPPAEATLSISFDQWWVALSRRMTLKPSLKEIMWADFNARGIKKEELPAKYEEGLKLFGL